MSADPTAGPTARRLLRDRLASGRTVWVPGCYDVLSARLIEAAGFEATIVSGFGVSASLLGMPDVELYTMTENLSVVRAVCAAVSMPVMADGDAGYGNAVNVMRAVREFERAGAASITFEDQASPKKCPALTEGNELLPIDSAAAKIRAAVAARRDPDMIIIARTDARTPEEATRRGVAYAEAGADVVKPMSQCFQDADGLRGFREAVGRPIHITVLGSVENRLSRAQIEALAGFATFPLVPLLTAAEAIQQNLAHLRASLRMSELPLPLMPETVFKRFIGYEEIERIERSYLVRGG